jgi:hypothetical protein
MEFDKYRAVQITYFGLAVLAVGLNCDTRHDLHRVAVSGSTLVVPDDRTSVGPVLRVAIGNEGQKSARITSAKISLRGRDVAEATGWLDSLRGLDEGTNRANYWKMPISVGAGAQRNVGLVLDGDRPGVRALVRTMRTQSHASDSTDIDLDVALSVDGETTEINGASLAPLRGKWRIRAVERGHKPGLDVVRPMDYTGKGVARLTVWPAQSIERLTRRSEPVLAARVASFRLEDLALGKYNWTMDVSGSRIGSGRGRVPCQSRCKRVWRDRSIKRPTQLSLPQPRRPDNSTTSPPPDNPPTSPPLQSGGGEFENFCQQNPGAC